MAEQRTGRTRNSGENSGGNPGAASKGRSKGRRPRRGPRRNSAAASASSEQTAPKSKSSGGGRSSAPRSKSKSQNRNRRPKSLTPARILQKYDNLLEQHLVARRKLYEMHGRVEGRQLEKIQHNFEKTLHSLRRFEEGLKDWQLDVLREKIDPYPEDRQFSLTNNLEPKGEEVPFSGEFEDPHLLPTQKEVDFSNDTEETIGSIEDYKSYKGLQ